MDSKTIPLKLSTFSIEVSREALELDDVYVSERDRKLAAARVEAMVEELMREACSVPAPSHAILVTDPSDRRRMFSVIVTDIS